MEMSQENQGIWLLLLRCHYQVENDLLLRVPLYKFPAVPQLPCLLYLAYLKEIQCCGNEVQLRKLLSQSLPLQNKVSGDKSKQIKQCQLCQSLAMTT